MSLVSLTLMLVLSVLGYCVGCSYIVVVDDVVGVVVGCVVDGFCGIVVVVGVAAGVCYVDGVAVDAVVVVLCFAVVRIMRIGVFYVADCVVVGCVACVAGCVVIGVASNMVVGAAVTVVVVVRAVCRIYGCGKYGVGVAGMVADVGVFACVDVGGICGIDVVIMVVLVCCCVGCIDINVTVAVCVVLYVRVASVAGCCIDCGVAVVIVVGGIVGIVGCGVYVVDNACIANCCDVGDVVRDIGCVDIVGVDASVVRGTCVAMYVVDDNDNVVFVVGVVVVVDVDGDVGVGAIVHAVIELRALLLLNIL